MHRSLRGTLDVNVGASGDAPLTLYLSLDLPVSALEWRGEVGAEKTSSNPHALILKHTFADRICFMRS